jgi:Mg-chelatase subunit ChlD
MRAQQKPFQVIKAKLPPRASRKESEPVVIVVDKSQRDEQKRRDKRAKALAVQAFRCWRPGG